MPVTPTLLLEAAQALRQGGSEVDQRNAASRAYYAAYHRCLPIAEGIGLVATGKGVHRDLIDTLIGARPPKLKSIGYMLEQGRRLRVKADYEIASEFARDQAQTVMGHCEAIFNSADVFERKAREPDEI
jgi:uncharacterized protein (UPF0332 family)